MYDNVQAKLYDLVYSNKDYESETNFALKIIQEHSLKNFLSIDLLDIGCGTGKHSLLLGRKLKRILAIDQSAEMIGIAHRQTVKENNVSFEASSFDENFKCEEKFDVITLFFNVFGYIVNAENGSQILKKLHTLLEPNGLLIFDIWDCKTLSSDYEKIRVKEFNVEGITYQKRTFGIVNYENQSIQVNIEWTSDLNIKKDFLLHEEKFNIQTFDVSKLEEILKASDFIIKLSKSDVEEDVPSIDGRSHWIVAKKI